MLIDRRSQLSGAPGKLGNRENPGLGLHAD